MTRAYLTATFAFLAALVAAAQPPVRTMLLVVDDLHLDFRMTPRTRELLGSAVLTLLKSNVRCALVSTSGHLAMVGPTDEADPLRRAVGAVVGESLKPSELLDFPSQQVNLEVEHRAKVASASGVKALADVTQSSRLVSVLLFTAGYDDEAVSPPDEMVAASLRVNAPLNIVDMFDVLDASGASGDVLNAVIHRAGRHQSLVALAERTHGTLVQDQAAFDRLLARLSNGN